MDFLWSDGIPDLLLQSKDSILCYSGAVKNFMRILPDWLHPDLAIPNPAILDSVNFKGNGKGLFEWVGIFDAGNINGSGEHSLATLGGYVPDLNGMFAISYCMIYSGGKAADEKADAVFADNTATYGGFTYCDTVQSSLADPMSLLIGDPSFDNGGVGKLYFVKGDRNIPYTADPRWTNGVINRNTFIPLAMDLISNPVKDIASIRIHTNGWMESRLSIRDLLGRTLISQKNFPTGNEQQTLNIDLSSLSTGAYLLELSQNNSTVITRIILTH
jgi:hypothetical protein